MLKLIIQKIKKIANKLIKIIHSTYLCIRFPFLYPRNRFTSKHYTNWKLQNYLTKLHNKAYFKPYIIVINDLNNPIKLYGSSIWEEPFLVTDKLTYNNGIVWLTKDKDTIKVFYNRNLVGLFKISDYLKSGKCDDIKFVTYTKTRTNFLNEKTVNDTYYIAIYSKDGVEYLSDEKENFFSNAFLTFRISNSYYVWHKFIKFIYDYVLQIIFCIPTYTELDAMPDGWRKTFGIQMCEELKKELKKYNYLYKYRITQIKEKYGTLRWDSYGSPEGCEYPIIDKYEDLSQETCIICGKPATYISKGWVSPYCEDCIGDKNKATPINKFY